LKRIPALLAACFLLALLAGCGEGAGARRSDAELGLNAQQAEGRRVFHAYCTACHYAYSSRGMKGPGLKDLYKKKYLPSGLPANDRFVGQAIANGRGMMPAFGNALSQEQFDDLIAYLHTL
jgi:mono/diheme cytochrome c family protein